MHGKIRFAWLAFTAPLEIEVRDLPANVADDPGSMFVTGETWAAPGGALILGVSSASANGLVVSVNRAADDLVFRNGF